MKKLIRWVVILGLVFVVLLGVGLAVALNSSVQTKIALNVLHKTDPQAKLDSVSFGFGSGEVHGLEMTTAGTHVKLGSAKLAYSVTNLIFGATKIIESAEVKDLVIDLTVPRIPAAPAAPGAAGEKKPLPAVLVKKADISGSVLLALNRSLELSLSAQNVGADGDGKATGNVIYHDKTPGAQVSEMRAATQAAVALDSAMFPKNLDCTLDLTATLPGQTQSAQLSAHLLAKPVSSKAGELTVTLAPPGGTPLLSFKGSYATDGSINGDFTADLNRTQIEPFALGFKLPDFTLRGQGQIAADAAAHSGNLKAVFNGSAGYLEVLRPELAGMGTLALDANLDLAVAQSKTAEKTFSLAGKTLKATLAPQGGQTAVAVELLKPVTIEYGANGLQLPTGAGADILKLTLTRAPAAWLMAAVPKDYTVTGQFMNGEVVLSALDNGTLSANTTNHVTLEGLNVQHGQETLLVNANFGFDGAVQYADKSLQAQVRLLSFIAHGVGAGGVTLSSLSPNPILRGGFGGNVSVVPGLPLPKILVTGKFNTSLEFDQIDQKALGKTLPPLAPAGLLTLGGNLDVSTAVSATDPKDLSLNVNAFDATIGKGDAATRAIFVTLASLQKFSLPLGANAKLQPVSGNLATLEITGFPLTVAQAFLPSRFKFAGSPLKGKILLTGEANPEQTITLHTTEPFTIANALFTQDLVDKLTGVTLTMAPEGVWKPGEIKATARLQAVSTAGTLLDASVEATQSKDTVTATITANGQLAAIAAQPLGLEWRNFLPATKPQFTVSASLTRSPQSIVVKNAEASVAPAGGAALADIKLSQAVTLLTDPTDAKKILWPKINGDVLSIKMGNLPAGVLALALPGYRLQGRDLSADLLLHGAGDGSYTLSSSAPISATGLSFAKLNENTLPTEWVRDLTFTFKPTATFSNEGISAGAVQDLRLSSANTPLVSGHVDFVFAPKQAKAAAALDLSQLFPQQAKVSIQADLAQLLRQPVLAKFNNLATGQFTLEGALDPDGSVRGNGGVTNWTVRGSQTQLPQMMFQNVSGKFNRATNDIQINIPVKGQSNEGPTDCLLAATYGPSGTSHKFTLNVTGNNLVIDDLLAVKAGLFPPAAPPPTTTAATATPAPTPVAATTPAKVVPDMVPLWGDLQGTAQIQLKTLRFHAFFVDNFQTTAQVTPTQATIPGVSGLFQGAPLTLNASLAFDAKQIDQPYSLQTSMSFKSFDVGAYFRSRDAKATPPVEGNFSITGNAAGRGGNINDVIDKVQFDFKLSSDGGTFHLLDLIPNKTVGNGLKALSTIGGVANAVAGLFGKKDVTDGKAAIAKSVIDLLANLDAIKYSKLAFDAARGPDLTVKLNQFDLQSAEVELVGVGQIKYVRGLAIPDQPLTATLTLNAKGGIAQGLQAIHLLGAAAPSGYSVGPKFEVGGTMQHPDYKAFENFLAAALPALGLK